MPTIKNLTITETQFRDLTLRVLDIITSQYAHDIRTQSIGATKNLLPQLTEKVQVFVDELLGSLEWEVVADPVVDAPATPPEPEPEVSTEAKAPKKPKAKAAKKGVTKGEKAKDDEDDLL